MNDRTTRLRVALVAGLLAQGGAEKQFVYMARALQEASADVRVFCLTRGEHYEAALRDLGLPPIWFGHVGNPAGRVAALAVHFFRFQPHIVQASHSFVNLHATLAARTVGALAFGAMRCSVGSAQADEGVWHRWGVQLPDAVLSNSRAAAQELVSGAVQAHCVHVLPNVIDIAEFERQAARESAVNIPQNRVVAMFCARLVRSKRLDRFLQALALAVRVEPNLYGVVVGDGPERAAMELMACDLELVPDHVQFLGRRDDVPALLRRADLVVLCSDGDEGMPNVLMEAMTAAKPIITTPAGDAPLLVRHGETGYVVPFDGVDQVAAYMVKLARHSALRHQLGHAGRFQIGHYNSANLAATLLAIYTATAEQQHHNRVLRVLAQTDSFALPTA